MPGRPLNQYAISRILGSQVKAISALQFGGFGVISTAAEILRSNLAKEAEHAEPSEADDRLIAGAFTSMADGRPPDHLLWDMDFADLYVDRCRESGLALPPPLLKRRLLNIRKNAPRYRDKGIELPEATKKEELGKPPDRAVHAIEFALVRLRYRYGVSIDDILMDDLLGREFEQVALRIAPGMDVKRLRSGALYLRKCGRRPSKRLIKTDAYVNLSIPAFENAMTHFGPLASLKERDIPEAPGVLKILERGIYLFVSSHDSLRASVLPYLEGRALEAMADAFWKPDPRAFEFSAYLGRKFGNASIHTCELKLITERQPVFNWPVIFSAA